MNPAVSKIVSKLFYKGLLKDSNTLPKYKYKRLKKFGPIQFYNIKGKE